MERNEGRPHQTEGGVKKGLNAMDRNFHGGESQAAKDGRLERAARVFSADTTVHVESSGPSVTPDEFFARRRTNELVAEAQSLLSAEQMGAWKALMRIALDGATPEADKQSALDKANAMLGAAKATKH